LAQTQQLAIELGDQPAGRRLREVEFSLRRLAQLSEKLLQLSRLDAGFAQAESASDLLPALRLVVRDFQVASRTQSRVRLQVAQGLALVGRINLDAFAIAVRNLIQNALIHGAPDGLVEVIAGPGRQVRVINAGPVVPGATLARIAEPFRRGSTSAKGTGLGLSIVRSIMDQTDGSLSRTMMEQDSSRRHAAKGIVLQDEVMVQRHETVETGDNEKHGSAVAVEVRDDTRRLLDRCRQGRQGHSEHGNWDA
jgi:two-component system OmpR family sensor kinase